MMAGNPDYYGHIPSVKLLMERLSQSEIRATPQTHATFLPPGETVESIDKHHRSCALRHGGTACTC